MFKMMFTFNKSMQVYTAQVTSEGSVKEMKGSFLEIFETGRALACQCRTWKRCAG
jgi:hypothetical protein